MKKGNRQIFYIATFSFMLLLIPCFLVTAAEEDGTLGTDSFWQIFIIIFKILRFPTHSLWWSFFSGSNRLIYFSGLIINCMLYGLAIEKVANLINPPKPVNKNEFRTGT
ncbi:MAG: hypothetical protein QM791_06495 [Ferruginibacter sp.]